MTFRIIGLNIVKASISQCQKARIDWGVGLRRRIFYLLSLFGLCLLGRSFGFEPGFCVPASFQDEVVPSPFSFDKIYAHKGPPLLGKTENLRASYRPVPLYSCKPTIGFCAETGLFPRVSLYVFRQPRSTVSSCLLLRDKRCRGCDIWCSVWNYFR